MVLKCAVINFYRALMSRRQARLVAHTRHCYVQLYRRLQLVERRKLTTRLQVVLRRNHMPTRDRTIEKEEVYDMMGQNQDGAGKDREGHRPHLREPR
jgi:hypothetical protein